MEEKRGTTYRWFALLTVSIGTFMATLDSSIVNISFPRLTEVFNTDPSIVLWITVAYLLATSLASFMPHTHLYRIIAQNKGTRNKPTPRLDIGAPLCYLADGAAAGRTTSTSSLKCLQGTHFAVVYSSYPIRRLVCEPMALSIQS